LGLTRSGAAAGKGEAWAARGAAEVSTVTRAPGVRWRTTRSALKSSGTPGGCDPHGTFQRAGPASSCTLSPRASRSAGAGVAFGVGDGELESSAGGGGANGDGDVRVAAHGDERVPGRGGEHRGRGHPAGGEDAGDVVPLAARGVVDGGDAVDPADGERAGQRG